MSSCLCVDTIGPRYGSTVSIAGLTVPTNVVFTSAGELHDTGMPTTPILVATVSVSGGMATLTLPVGLVRGPIPSAATLYTDAGFIEDPAVRPKVDQAFIFTHYQATGSTALQVYTGAGVLRADGSMALHRSEDTNVLWPNFFLTFVDCIVLTYPI